MQCFLTHVKHEPTVLDFAAAVPITPPAPPAAKKSGGGKNGASKQASAPANKVKEQMNDV